MKKLNNENIFREVITNRILIAAILKTYTKNDKKIKEMLEDAYIEAGKCLESYKKDSIDNKKE